MLLPRTVGLVLHRSHVNMRSALLPSMSYSPAVLVQGSRALGIDTATPCLLVLYLLTSSPLLTSPPPLLLLHPGFCCRPSQPPPPPPCCCFSPPLSCCQMAKAAEASPPRELISRRPCRLLGMALANPLISYMCVVGFLLSVAAYTFIFFLPMIVGALLGGHSLAMVPAAKAGQASLLPVLLTSIPYTVGAITTWVVAHSSQKRQELYWHCGWVTGCPHSSTSRGCPCSDACFSSSSCVSCGVGE